MPELKPKPKFKQTKATVDEAMKRRTWSQVNDAVKNLDRTLAERLLDELRDLAALQDDETNDGPRKLWERMPKEKARYYDAFQRYLRQPAYRRSIAGAAADLLAEDGVYPGDEGYARRLRSLKATFRSYATRFNWRARAEAWDDYVAKQTRAELLQQILDMRLRHSQIGRALQRLGQARISEDGFYKKLTPNQALRYIEAGVNIERMARGAPSEIVGLALPSEIEVQWGRRHNAEIMSSSDEELSAAEPTLALTVADGGESDEDNDENIVDGEVIDVIEPNNVEVAAETDASTQRFETD